MNNEKPALRAEMKSRAAALTTEYNEAASAAITQKLLALDAYKTAKTVFCFVGTGMEIDTRTFLSAVLADGKMLCVPFCETFGIMHAKKISALNELIKGKYDILSPSESAVTIPPQNIDFAVIPCLAASLSGARLGYGGGFYDRFIPTMSNAVSVCICRKKMLCDNIPIEAHDIKIDLITE